MERKKESGTLMTWFADRGFGFVHHEINGEVKTYFVHISNVVGMPAVGASVRFEASIGRKGPKAVNVEVLPSGGTR